MAAARGTEDRRTRQLGTANGDLFDTECDGQGIHWGSVEVQGNSRDVVIGKCDKQKEKEEEIKDVFLISKNPVTHGI